MSSADLDARYSQDADMKSGTLLSEYFLFIYDYNVINKSLVIYVFIHIQF